MSVTVAGWIMATLFALCGLLGLTASLLNLEWFFRSRGVSSLVGRLRRPWQRALYAILGIAMLAMAYNIIATLYPTGV